MNAPANITRPWDYHSGVPDCETCEGHGHVSNGRGRGGNDPDSWNVECRDCDGNGHHVCAVCGFDTQVAGYDCLACATVSELADRDLTRVKPEELAAALGAAMQARLCYGSEAGSMSGGHTPGPWWIYESAGEIMGEYPGIEADGGSVVCFGDDMEGVRGDTCEERLANARLIAAAPELLEALDWAVNEFDGKTRYASEQQRLNCIDKCRDALRKARGKA